MQLRPEEIIRDLFWPDDDVGDLIVSLELKVTFELSLLVLRELPPTLLLLSMKAISLYRTKVRCYWVGL